MNTRRTGPAGAEAMPAAAPTDGKGTNAPPMTGGGGTTHAPATLQPRTSGSFTPVPPAAKHGAQEMKNLLTAGLLGLTLCGCASNPDDHYFRECKVQGNVYVAPGKDSIRKVAVLPFKAPTELIGSSVSDMFVTELLRAGRYELVERGQMANVLGEAELALAGLSASKATEVGQMLGADGVIIGTVDEYGTVAKGGKVCPSVGISIRLIECKSGKIVWSADLAERANPGQTTLAVHARKVVHEMTATLYKKWNR